MQNLFCRVKSRGMEFSSDITGRGKKFIIWKISIVHHTLNFNSWFTGTVLPDPEEQKGNGEVGQAKLGTADFIVEVGRKRSIKVPHRNTIRCYYKLMKQ